MVLVLDGVPQQITMELLDVVLGEINPFPVGEDHVHGVGVTGNFLLIPGRKELDLDVRKQLFNLAVGQLRTFDTCRRAECFRWWRHA